MLINEVILMAASLSLYTSKHRDGSPGNPQGSIRDTVTNWEIVEAFIDVTRVVCLSALVGLYTLFRHFENSKSTEAVVSIYGYDDEVTTLLNGHKGANGVNGHYKYGATDSSSDEDEPGWVRKDKAPKKTWWEFVRAYSLFLPYLWPSKSRRLQVLVGICGLLVAFSRVINILVPIQIGKITNILSGEDKSMSGIPWVAIFVFVLLRLLQGNNGILNASREYLWIPINQYCFRELSVASFEHVHGLSLDFHLGKKTGEVTSALNKGASINTFLGLVSFQFLPMMIDLAVAVGYLLVVTIIAFMYVYITIRLAAWRTDVRRDLSNLDRNMEAVK